MIAFTQTTEELVDSHLQNGKAIRFTIPTGSMWPTLAPGDTVIVRATRPQALHLGDIVVVKAGQVRLAHRLIERRRSAAGASLVTKGDNGLMADAARPETEILGLVVAVERNGRRKSLRSAWAKGTGAVLARLSRWQGRVASGQPGLWRRVVLKGLRPAISVVARL